MLGVDLAGRFRLTANHRHLIVQPLWHTPTSPIRKIVTHSKQHSNRDAKLLRVGELAKRVGKTVRALHLYEELGLLSPVSRTTGGFRLYQPTAAARIEWIIKFQAIGFSLTEIRGFVTEFEEAQSGQAGTHRVRAVFAEKLAGIREQITSLQVVENDLVEAIDYLESCQSCAPSVAVDECHVCNHHGHQPGEAPALFAQLSGVANPNPSSTSKNGKTRSKLVVTPNTYDVAIETLATRISTKPTNFPTSFPPSPAKTKDSN